MVKLFQNVLICAAFWVPGGETGTLILTDFPPVAFSNCSLTRFLPGCCWLEIFGNPQELQLGIEPLSKQVENNFRGFFLNVIILLSFQSVFELRSYDYFLSPHQLEEFLLAKSNFTWYFHPPAVHSLKNACSSQQFCSETIITL